MLYNYTVTLQSKTNHKPRRFKTTAHNLTEVFQSLRKTLMAEHYTVKSVKRALV